MTKSLPDGFFYASELTVPTWIVRAGSIALRRFEDGKAPMCQHALAPGETEVVILAWREGLVTCEDCKHLRFATKKVSSTCSCCGAEGIDGAIALASFESSKVTYAAVLCPQCQSENGVCG